ncbi:hypothetical protein ES707_19752 [subsurface metagenome]
MEADKLGDFISVYEKFATAEDKSPRTIQAVKYAVTKFDKFLGGCTSIEAVQTEDLGKYIRHLQEQPKWFGHPTIRQSHGNLSDNSIASYIRRIRSLWS